MLDLDLLRTLVCVVDERSFSRAAERVHRTQSTVSQQILKLEDKLGQPLLLRDRSGRHVSPTEAGERLANYARRLLAIAREAEESLARPAALPPVRVGVPEDFDALRMSSVLAGFTALHPGVRLETMSGMSTDLRSRLAAGEIDVALVKREPGSGDCLQAWPERLAWVAGPGGVPHEDGGDVPLALFPQGCIYRQRAIRALESAGRPWRIAFGSQSLTGIQAAVSCGLAITVLPVNAMLADHVRLGPRDGFPTPGPTELALIGPGRPLTDPQREVARYLQARIDKATKATSARRAAPRR